MAMIVPQKRRSASVRLCQNQYVNLFNRKFIGYLPLCDLQKCGQSMQFCVPQISARALFAWHFLQAPPSRKIMGLFRHQIGGQLIRIESFKV
jgi:hypothetical protein